MNELPDLTSLSDAEKDVLIRALGSRIDELEQEIERLKARVAELEGQRSKSSRNSHRPPSSDGPKKPKPKSRRERSGKAAGGQAGHAGHRLTPVADPDHTIRYEVTHCERCQDDLSHEAVEHIECRQEFDLPPLHLVVTEHQVEVKCCPRCGHRNRGVFPAQVSQPVQYGAGVRALVIYLSRYQLLPYERLSELFADWFGQGLSPGTVATINQEAHERLAGFEQALTAHLVSAPVVHFDESGLQVKGQRWWLHVASTERLTGYRAHGKRGREAMDAMGILPRFQGTAVHDHWKPYLTYSCHHGLCNAHHLRELTYVHEQYDQPWAQQMIRCLVTMKQVVDEAKAHHQDHLAPAAIGVLVAQYDRLLNDAQQQVPPPPPPPPGKTRGRPKQSVPQNLLNRLRDYRSAVLAFLYDFRVPFDNNQAERDVRMIKVQQKISGTFRSEKGAASFCRVRSYISTVRKHALKVIDALRSIFMGTPLLPGVLAQPPPV